MDAFCSKHIDEEAYYADIKRFQDINMEPETCPCDYCDVNSKGCPFDATGNKTLVEAEYELYMDTIGADHK